MLYNSYWNVRNQRFNAKPIALRTSPSFSLDKVVINDPMLDFETVCMWSQLTAQSLFMPSRRDKGTSLGILRIVEVTVISMKTLIVKSLLTSLCQREEKFPSIKRGLRGTPLWQRGARGDFSIMIPCL